MSQPHLHIVALDVPLPADYGGVMDIFYKIAWLHKLGVKIHLHCFSSGRPPQDELDSYCEEVFYYKRKNFVQAFPLRIPYMVGSRDNAALLKNLQQDEYPVLLEGIQCSYLLHSNALTNRKVFLRLHNAEFLYYRKLASFESNIIKRLYYKNESRLLRKYEKEITDKAPILSLSKSDISLYKKFFKALKISFIPAFTAWDKMSSAEGRGEFCLYHGNLGINENEKAVEWLLEEVFKNSSIPLIIAGKRPSDRLQALVNKHPNCILIENPTNTELQDLVQKAQVNILPSFNNTGVKLKLLNALYNGRHCLVNTAAIEGAAVPTLCEVADTAKDFAKKASLLFEKDFTQEDILHRSKVLAGFYDNEKNAGEIVKMLQEERKPQRR